MKKRVRVEVINGDWEIKKNKMRQGVKAAIAKAKSSVYSGGKYFMIGAGIGVVIILKESFS